MRNCSPRGARSRTRRKIGAAKTAKSDPTSRKDAAVESPFASVVSLKRSPDTIVPRYPSATPTPESLPRVSGRATSGSSAS